MWPTHWMAKPKCVVVACFTKESTKFDGKFTFQKVVFDHKEFQQS